MIASMTLNIMDLTIAFDSAFESLQAVRMKIQEKLMTTYEKGERYQLKFLLENVKSLSPMNAFGYFEISKSTLTSMLSVRYYLVQQQVLDLDVTEAVSDMVKTDQNDGNILPLFQNWAAALDIKSSQSPAAVMNNYHGRALCMATFNGGNIT